MLPLMLILNGHDGIEREFGPFWLLAEGAFRSKPRQGSLQFQPTHRYGFRSASASCESCGFEQQQR